MTSRLKGSFFCLIALSAIFLFLAEPIFGADDVVINEFSSASNPEWIELYNPTENTISLDDVNLLLDDDPETSQKISFCAGEEIGDKSFKRIVRPEKSYWLANDGDAIFLKREDDVIDAIFYGTGQSLGAPSDSQSASRNPDGGIDWIILDTPTLQGDIVSFECPTPTPEPTPTEEPEEEPTPTPTPETPTPTPTPTKKPTPKPTPTLIPTPTEEILGEEATPAAEEPTPTPMVLGEKTSNPVKFIPLVFIGLGSLLLLTSGGFILSPKLKMKYNHLRKSGEGEKII